MRTNVSKTKKPDPAEGAAPSFEAALERLEDIVEQLDGGNLPLEDSLALFKEGTALARHCRSLLAAAEVQVKEALAREPVGGQGEEEQAAPGPDYEYDEGDGEEAPFA